MNKNILITSISSKIPLIKTVFKAKKKFDNTIKIYGIDINDEVLGKYFVDEFYIVPKLSKIDIQEFINDCKLKKIKYIFPTRDEDVLFYSSFMNEFIKNDIHVFSPSYDVANLCFDKYLFVKENQVDFNIKTALEIDELKKIKKFVVKERFGSGSKNLGLNLTYKQAKEFSEKLNEAIFQEFIVGEEYSIDSYVDKTNKFIGCVIRKRELIQNGEAIITFSLEDVVLEEKIKLFLTSNKIFGHSITQVIKKDEEYFLIECNTRFGGASTLSYKMGLKSFYWFLCQTNNKKIKFIKNNKNFRQIRIPKDIYFEC